MSYMCKTFQMFYTYMTKNLSRFSRVMITNVLQVFFMVHSVVRIETVPLELQAGSELGYNAELCSLEILKPTTVLTF